MIGALPQRQTAPRLHTCVGPGHHQMGLQGVAGDLVDFGDLLGPRWQQRLHAQQDVNMPSTGTPAARQQAHLGQALHLHIGCMTCAGATAVRWQALEKQVLHSQMGQQSCCWDPATLYEQ